MTLYTSQNPAFLANTAKAFESSTASRSPSTANRLRPHDRSSPPRKSAHKLNVDVLVIASLPIVYGMQKPDNRWVADAVGPALYAKAYDRKVFGGPQNANVVGCALLGMAWNTGLYPTGLKDFPTS